MLMFWDALRKAARRHYDIKNQIFLQLKKTEFYSDYKKNNYSKIKETNIPKISSNVFYLNFAFALRYGTAFSNS